VMVSSNNLYVFTVTENVNLVANFYALDFDTYSPMLWDNTFLLNLKRLREEGYEVSGCKWFKNGVKERDTHTINEFSYSAGPNRRDLLDMAPAYYMFMLNTKNFGELCSTLKIITERNFSYYSMDGETDKLVVYPNPVVSGYPFTIEGIIEGSEIQIYNQYGARVANTVAIGNPMTLTLHVAPGIYLARVNDKEIKIVVVKW